MSVQSQVNITHAGMWCCIWHCGCAPVRVYACMCECKKRYTCVCLNAFMYIYVVHVNPPCMHYLPFGSNCMPRSASCCNWPSSVSDTSKKTCVGEIEIKFTRFWRTGGMRSFNIQRQARCECERWIPHRRCFSSTRSKNLPHPGWNYTCDVVVFRKRPGRTYYSVLCELVYCKVVIGLCQFTNYFFNTTQPLWLTCGHLLCH